MTSSNELPPGPRAPAFIQTLRLVRDAVGFLTDCHARYGDVFTLRISGYGPLVHIANPDDLRLMFNRGPDEAYAGESNHRLFGALTGRDTSLTLDGVAHQKRRKAISGAYQSERMAGYVASMRAVTQDSLDRWPRDKSFALHERVQAIALEVMLRTVFGLQVDDDAKGARAGAFDELRLLLVRTANDAAGSPLLLLAPLQIDLGPLSPWGRITRLLSDTRKALEHEIERRRALLSQGAGAMAGGSDGRAPGAAPDVFSMLLQARDEDGNPLTGQGLRDELIVQLLAGHETTASALAWAFSCLLEDSACLAILRKELDTVVGTAPIEGTHLSQLPYLDAVVRESMRLRPIMPTAGARHLKVPLRLSRFTLPAGIFVANSEIVLHRRADLYPDPLAFRPERFLNRKPEPYTFTPFGGGGRRCIGMHLALTEMKVVLATVLQQVDLTLETSPVTTGRRGFFIAPRGGPRVKLTERPTSVR